MKPRELIWYITALMTQCICLQAKSCHFMASYWLCTLKSIKFFSRNSNILLLNLILCCITEPVLQNLISKWMLYALLMPKAGTTTTFSDYICYTYAFRFDLVFILFKDCFNCNLNSNNFWKKSWVVNKKWSATLIIII